MKASISTICVAIAAMANLWTIAPVMGAEGSKCDKVSADLKAAIERQPKKTLVFLEDAIVANEGCVCEIVKTAIITSKADADLVRQIVLTATNVEPKMSAIIAECAAAVAPAQAPQAVQGVQTADNGKSVKQVVSVQPPESSGSDFTQVPADIRGVYLIQPSAAIITTQPTTAQNKIVVHHKPPQQAVPQSPSEAQPCKKDP